MKTAKLKFSTPGFLAWHDGRWHLDGVGIHAGDSLYLRSWDNRELWFLVRVESTDAGRRLYAHWCVEGFDVVNELNLRRDKLQWAGNATDEA